MSPADGALIFAGRRQCWNQEGRRRYISNCEDTGAQGRHQGWPSVSINKYSIAFTILERKPRLTLQSYYAKVFSDWKDLLTNSRMSEYWTLRSGSSRYITGKKYAAENCLTKWTRNDEQRTIRSLTTLAILNLL